jgi:hypothetical protein
LLPNPKIKELEKSPKFTDAMNRLGYVKSDLLPIVPSKWDSKSQLDVIRDQLKIQRQNKAFKEIMSERKKLKPEKLN